MAESRSIAQITLDALGREKARLAKKLATSKEKTECPISELLEARGRVADIINTKPVDYRALEQAGAEHDRLAKRVKRYQKQDNTKLYDEQTTLRIEILAIDEQVAMIEYRRSKRR